MVVVMAEGWVRRARASSWAEAVEGWVSVMRAMRWDWGRVGKSEDSSIAWVWRVGSSLGVM